MGLFDKFGAGKLPPLDTNSTAARQLNAYDSQLDALARGNIDRIEVVPDDGALYVYLGKLPKAFGFVWFEDGQRHDIKSMIESGRLTADDVPEMGQKLIAAHEASEAEPRYSYEVGGRKIIVTPSATLARSAAEAVSAALAA